MPIDVHPQRSCPDCHNALQISTIITSVPLVNSDPLTQNLMEQKRQRF